MTQWHMKSKRKVTSGILKTQRRSDKRLIWKGGDPTETVIAQSDDAIERRTHKALGNQRKVKVRLDRYIMATDKDTKKVKKLEILTVVENDANTQYARRNVITKGAVLKCKDGSAETHVKVTSRPGQSGVIYGVVLKDFHKHNEDQLAQKKAKKADKTREKAKKEEK